MPKYDEKFYLSQMEESYNSAKELLKQITPLLPEINSVIDVGCGVGTWLKAWQDQNHKIKILGIDGNNVDKKYFYIDQNNYKKIDLSNNYKNILIQLKLTDENKEKSGKGKGKPFDLAQSLEVAEHLEEKHAENFIQLLTSLSDIVLFSAAIPHQGGTDHFNEQPPAYWAKLFQKFDYICFDILRYKIWDNKNIAFWYRQNTMLYIHKNKSHIFEDLGYKSTQNPLHLVRPDYLEAYIKECKKLERRTLFDIGKFYLRHPKRMFINKNN
ncbi:class I SAM-dependent methyltransferase [Campylobacter lari]|uniref:class I SAM-dependent methyltransferase n=1 Tax=Campylobacter lari TaxID=201 RepID=UPI0021F6BA82|nr:class I SAM-dependent methyltransferase [Campylobacter lari]MCW0226126.1 class I SAM-dependent methyltransferase [Campylobacter lari]MCW0242577.1 class I SAM-dependent methyltransferase [Campylobacter lari]MCW0255280.1 class I SAM-dependent methyltransferase [Campylobacter lari]